MQRVDFSFCGMAVDVLRSCYRSKMRVDPSRPDLLVEFEWFFTPPGAKIFPFPTAFSSRNYTETNEHADLTLGEVEITKRWVRGDPPAAVPGTFFCGDPSSFVNGADLVNGPLESLDVDGVPLCCRGGVPFEDDVRDINFWRQVSGVGLDVYYTGGSVTGQGQAPVAAEADVIHCLPLFASRGGTLDQLAIWLDNEGDAGAKLRLAIYEATSDTDLTPSVLVAQTAELDADVGAGAWLAEAINVILDPRKLYWLCVNASSVVVMPIVGACSSVFYFNVLGFDANTFSPFFGFKVPFTFGAFPATFPAVTQSNLANGDIEAAGVRYSG
jgi:hypothetical protein